MYNCIECQKYLRRWLQKYSGSDKRAAKDGDTVYVKGGIYNESISISKSIKLIGSHDGNETILNGMRVSTAINVFADNVEITGFTILNSNRGIWMYGSNNSSIYSNTIENVNYAISITYGNYNKIYNNSIAMCVAIMDSI